MGRLKFSVMEKELDLDEIEGKYSAFARVPFALPVRMNHPLAEDGYGEVRINGKLISRGKPFTMQVLGETHCLLLPAGEAALEYERTYQAVLENFRAKDGSVCKKQVLSFRTKPRKMDMSRKKHDQAALEGAREGMVLLRNEGGVLPLMPEENINCFGAGQYMMRSSSTGAGLINPRWQANFHQAIQEHSSFCVNEELAELYRGLKDVLPTREQAGQAKAFSDTALMLISRCSGEFLDNRPVEGEYYLTKEERELLSFIGKNFQKSVVVINSGYPIEMGWIQKYGISAVVYAGYGGMGTGYALMELLDGRVNPSGRLPDTWAYDYWDYPSAANFIHQKQEDAPIGEKDYGVRLFYEEDIYVGYRYFSTFEKPCAYPFGYGQSYTSFSLEEVSCTFGETEYQVKATIKNSGDYPGKYAALLYVSAPEQKLEKPARVLAAFEKTMLLAPGETQDLTLEFKESDIASYSEEEGAYILEAGTYRIYLGGDVDTAEKVGSFVLEQEKVLRRTGRIARPVETFHRMSKKEPYVKEDSGLVPLEERIPVKAEQESYHPKLLRKEKRAKIILEDVKKDPGLAENFAAQLSDRELCAMNVCGGANWYFPWQDGSAGKTRPIRRLGIPSVKVSDGNAGVHINRANIGFACSTVLAASFNKELAYETGRVLGEESKENGIAVNLGPGMNLHRNILNGRHPEYFSEDPLLAGTMAGMQAKGIEDAGTGCTYKHLFCNNSDTSRKGSHSIVSERALRELYFRVFEKAFEKQRPTCLMTSYNALNGIYPAQSAQILQKLVRGEWKFTGLIMTDWGTYDTVDPVEMVKAGNCWLTEGSKKYIQILYRALKSGKLDRACLQHNALAMIASVYKG